MWMVSPKSFSPFMLRRVISLVALSKLPACSLRTRPNKAATYAVARRGQSKKDDFELIEGASSFRGPLDLIWLSFLEVRQ